MIWWFCYLFDVQFLSRFDFHLLFVYVYVLVQVMARRIAVGSSKSLQHMVEQAVVRCGLELQSVAKFHGNERHMYGAIQGDSVIRLSLRVWYVCFCPLKHIWSDPPLCFSAWLCLFPFPFLVFRVIFVWKCGLRSESRSCANFCSFPAEISGIFSASNWTPFCVLHFFCKLQRVLKVSEVPSIYSLNSSYISSRFRLPHFLSMLSKSHRFQMFANKSLAFCSRQSMAFESHKTLNSLFGTQVFQDVILRLYVPNPWSALNPYAICQPFLMALVFPGHKVPYEYGVFVLGHGMVNHPKPCRYGLPVVLLEWLEQLQPNLCWWEATAHT